MENNKQEDLDMLYVLRSINKGIGRFFRSIVWLFEFSLKNFRTLALFIIVFVALCLGIYLLKKPYYRSQLSISHIRFENDYCYEMVESLDSYITGNENPALAERLSISKNDAAKVQSIKYKPLNENIASRFIDSVSVLLPFKVEVEVYDNSVLDTLQKGILKYLESNRYATKIKEIEKQVLEKTEQRLEKEITEIDSLKKIVNAGIVPRSSGNGIIFGEPLDPVLIYKRGMDLYEKKTFIAKKKLLNNSFEVIIGFGKSPKRANYGKVFYIGIGLLGGYLIGLLWLLKKRANSLKK
jgi:hypothetical protein